MNEPKKGAHLEQSDLTLRDISEKRRRGHSDCPLARFDAFHFLCACEAMYCDEPRKVMDMLPSDVGPKLQLLVYDSARELCRVAMPLASVDNLEHLFPDEDLQVVKDIGVDFQRVIADVHASGFAPQTLIDVQTPKRSYRIWIE